jgi:hypothetical protein
MSEMNSSTSHEEMNPELSPNISRVDEDLKIMETHSMEMANIESGIQKSMKKWDRRYKDSHFHSVPKGKKHQL